MALLLKTLFIFFIICCATTLGAENLNGNQEQPRAKVSDDQLETALNDKRYLMRQLKCALGEATCDPVGRRLKTLAPLVLRGACPNCSTEETRQIQKVLSHIQRNFPREWSKVIKQYSGV